MLIAVDGPDRLGKTTLFNSLKQRLAPAPVFVPNVPFHPELLPVVSIVEERTEALWRALYRPELMYIADRSPFTSNPAYARVYGRPVRSYHAWVPEVRFIYLRGDAVQLGRPPDALPQDYEASVRAFDAVAASYQSFWINAALSPEDVLEEALGFVRSCFYELAGRLRRTRALVDRAARG